MMRWFLNVRTSVKLALAFTMAVSIAIVVGVIGYRYLDSMFVSAQRVQKITRGALLNLTRARGLAEGFAAHSRSARADPGTPGDAEETVLLGGKIRGQLESFLQSRTELLALAREEGAIEGNDGSGRGVLDTGAVVRFEQNLVLLDAAATALPRSAGAAGTVEDGPRVPAAQAIQGTVELAQAVEGDVARLADAAVRRLQRTQEEGQAWMLLGAAVGCLIALLVAKVTTRVIVQPLRDMTAAAHRISEGDLSAEINHVSKDEVGGLADSFRNMQGSLRDLVAESRRISDGDLTHEVRGGGDLGGSFNRMVVSLRGLLAEIQDAGKQVRSSSARLLDGLQQSARVSREEAKVVEEVGGSMENLSTAARNIAASAIDVERTAAEASRVASEGSQSVGSALEGLVRTREQVADIAAKTMVLGDRTRRIGEVLKIIQEVAGEIHMLALNAAIEAAASAGEHGKRFTVVAAEVRRLAERTRQSAEEIRAILTEIQEAAEDTVISAEQGARQVEEGAQTATTARNALEEVIVRIHRTAEAAREISQATREQRQSSEAVALAMRDISRAVRQMAQGTENSTRAVEDLANLAGRFEDLTGTFRTG